MPSQAPVGLSVRGYGIGSAVAKSPRAHVCTSPLAGQRIWLTHGHRYLHGYQVSELAWWARKLEADIVVFGHTHVPLVKWFGDVLLVNPGSPVLPRSEMGATFAVLTVKEGERPEAEIYKL